MDYLFSEWGKLRSRLSNRYIFIFLDYDGTLAPIVETPERAAMPEETKEVLKELSRNKKCKIVIISGRSLKDLKERVGLNNVMYVGNHGLEIEGSRIKFESYVSPRYRIALKRIKNDLTKKFSLINGVILEDKGLSLSVHYRLVNPKYVPKVKAIFHEATIIYLVRNKIKVKSGKMVLEIRPPLEWGKGKAALWLLMRQTFASKEAEVLPIYLGDDLTDEGAFKVLRNKGLTVLIGKPKESHAQYYLKNLDEAVCFLKMILGAQTLWQE